jgi:phosphatidylserine decarboxylase
MTDESSQRHFPIAKEALELFVPFFILGIALFIINWRLSEPHVLFRVGGGVFILFALFILYFFRNPNRRINYEEGTILSPADGKVVAIAEVEENEYLHRKTTRVSIFLRIYDVHMNYAPANGLLEYKKYHKGRFGIAGFDKASNLNEHMMLGIDGNEDRMSLKVIAGMFARRIIIPMKEGDTMHAGERIGLIKFGSRADVFIPPEYDITVRIGNKVTGAQTIIARRK